MVFVGAGESSAEALFLQCPRLQCSCGVLTAESPHNAGCTREFSFAQAKSEGQHSAEVPGICARRVDRVGGQDRSRYDANVDKERKEAGWYLW